MNKDANSRIEKAVAEILSAVGEDTSREGLIDTPKRVAKMFSEIFSGLDEDPKKHLDTCFRAEDTHEPVIVKEIPFYSVCEHHLLPVVGTATVAYLPRNGVITGLSKLARLVEGYARRPQLQERVTKQVVDALMSPDTALHAKAALCIIKAEHFCMSMRGVRVPGTVTVTKSVAGDWATDSAARNEIMALIAS